MQFSDKRTGATMWHFDYRVFTEAGGRESNGGCSFRPVDGAVALHQLLLCSETGLNNRMATQTIPSFSSLRKFEQFAFKGRSWLSYKSRTNNVRRYQLADKAYAVWNIFTFTNPCRNRNKHNTGTYLYRNNILYLTNQQVENILECNKSTYCHYFWRRKYT